jgi:uncharacterized protein (AIM24 family)
MAVILNASTSSGFVQSADTSGVVQIQNNGTTRLEANGTGVVVTGTGSVSGDLSFNSGYGSVAVAYGCRAWVNFNGTGTVAIRSSGNVTSITDNGSADYTVNFTNAMPDVNYSASITITKASANTSSGGIAAASVSSTPTLMSETQLRVVTGGDAVVCAVAIFR